MVIVDRDRKHIVINPKRSLASVLKTVYLGGFIYAGVKILASPADVESGLKASGIDAGQIESLNDWLFFALFLFLVSAFLHHIRLYVTIELLEDPASQLHQDTIKGLDNSSIHRFMEQTVRLIITALVALKVSKPDLLTFFLEQIGYKNSQLWCVITNTDHTISTIPSYLLYLIIIYIVLMFWDFIVYFGGDIKNNNFSSLVLFLSHILGIIFCGLVLFAWVNHAGNNKSNDITGLVYLIFASIFFGSFYIIILLYYFFTNKEFWEVIRSMIWNLFQPYYGHICNGAVLTLESEPDNCQTCEWPKIIYAQRQSKVVFEAKKISYITYAFFIILMHFSFMPTAKTIPNKAYVLFIILVLTIIFLLYPYRNKEI